MPRLCQGAHPKQSLGLKAKLLSLGGTGTPMLVVPVGPLLLHAARMGAWLVHGLVEQQPKA